MYEFTENEAYRVGRCTNRRTFIRVDLLNENFVKIDTLEADIISGSLTLKNAVDSDLARRKGNLVLLSKKDLNENFYKITLKNRVQIYYCIEDKVRTIASGNNTNQSNKSIISSALLEINRNGSLSESTLTTLNSIFGGTITKVNAKEKLTQYNNLNKVIYENVKYEYNMGIYLLNSPNTKISTSDRTITLDLCDLIENYSTFSNGLIGKLSFAKDSNLATTIQNIATDSNLMGLSRTLIEACDSTIDSAQTFEQDTDLVDVLKKLISLHPIYDCYFNNEGIFVFELIKQRTTDMIIDYIGNSCPLIVSVDYKKNFENVRNDIIVLGAMITNSDGSTTQTKFELKNETGNELSIDKLGLHRKAITNDNNKTNAMCQSEATYYLEKYSNLAETLTLQVIPMPYLVPNKVIEVNLEFEDIIITGRWLIDSISMDLKFDGLQTITCHKLYQNNTNNLDGGTFTDISSGLVADGGAFSSTITGNTYNGGSF